MAEKACDGGRVFESGDFAECAECGTRVRWDVRDDPFWGFQHCPDKSPDIAAVDPAVARNPEPTPRADTSFSGRGELHGPTTRDPQSSSSQNLGPQDAAHG